MELTLSRGAMVTVDAEEFRAWVTPHLPAMSRLAARLTSDGDRDDVVQDALVRAWRRRSTFDPDRGSPQAWLLAIVADRSRRHRVRSAPPSAALVDVAEGPRADSDRRVDVERAMRRLARRQRLAVELHYFVGLPIAECAAVMGCSDGTVKSTLSDARRRLRTELEGVR